MTIQKIGRCWYNGKNKISLYELYNVWGRYINTRPSDITVEDVKNYLYAKKE